MVLPSVDLLPEVQAAIIGLTEGVLSLQDLEEYLMTEAKLNKSEASSIKRAVAHIPLGAQTLASNFSKIPAKGSIFNKKEDLWPMDTEAAPTSEGKKEGKSQWL